MKRLAIGSIAFFTTLAAGILLVSPLRPEFPTVEPLPKTLIPPQMEVTVTEQLNFVAEFHGISTDELFPIDNWNEKLIDEPTSEFFPEDVVTKPGQTWLVAEKEKNGEITLTSSRMKLTDGKNDGMTVSIRFSQVADPIFAVRDLKNVKPGKINTVYFNRLPVLSHDEDTPPKMERGYKRGFELNGKNYYLRVAEGTEEQGHRMGFLVLGDGSTEQVIDYSPYWEGMELHLGILVWAGDIDNDGKLDLYIDRSYGEEKSGTGLFLSSHANKGKLVKIAALFAHAGC